MKPELSLAAQDEIARIAQTLLDIATLKARQDDRDYHRLPVSSIQAALEAAYLAGLVDHFKRAGL
jgi:hypothetical protein